jgi:hypothetical protein
VSRSIDGPLRPARLIATAALLAFGVTGCVPTVSPSPTTQTTLPSPNAQASPEPTIVISISCTPEPGTVQRALRGDPCPGAVTAVELAVAQVRLPIRRIVIEPGPFYCEVVWPGIASPPACFGPLVIPGQYMHAWVSFQGSGEVAAVMLGRDIPANLDLPAASPLPWIATLVTVEVPPPGWVTP